MKFNPVCVTKTAAVASAILLCGSMGVAQMHQSSTPGQTTPSGQTTANGQTGSGTDSMNGMQMGTASAADKMFVRKSLQGGMAEVQLGQLTLQKSSNDQVKQFAQRMIDDHTKMGDQMKPIAQQVGVEVPNHVSKKDQAVMAKLQGLSGTAYDQAYVKDMVKDHKEDLSEFQMEASNGQDPAVKDAASQGSKVIAEHLQMVQQLAKDQNVSAGQ